MAHGPVVPQNFSSKQYSYENDFSGVFDALHQSFLVLIVIVCPPRPFVRYVKGSLMAIYRSSDRPSRRRGHSVLEWVSMCAGNLSEIVLFRSVLRLLRSLN